MRRRASFVLSRNSGWADQSWYLQGQVHLQHYLRWAERGFGQTPRRAVPFPEIAEISATFRRSERKRPWWTGQCRKSCCCCQELRRRRFILNCLAKAWGARNRGQTQSVPSYRDQASRKIAGLALSSASPRCRKAHSESKRPSANQCSQRTMRQHRNGSSERPAFKPKEWKKSQDPDCSCDRRSRFRRRENQPRPHGRSCAAWPLAQHIASGEENHGKSNKSPPATYNSAATGDESAHVFQLAAMRP